MVPIEDNKQEMPVDGARLIQDKERAGNCERGEFLGHIGIRFPAESCVSHIPCAAAFHARIFVTAEY